MEEGDDEPRPAHSEWMAERDRAAVHVHLLLVDPELADDGEALRRKRLVQLDEVDLVDADTCALEQLPDCGNRPDAHDTRVDPGDRASGEAAERLDAELLRLRLARDHERGGPVVDPAVVSGLGCSSWLTSSTARSSSSKRPAFAAAAQRCCERSANASWSSRLTPQRSATFSPVSPIDSSRNFSSSRGFGKRHPSVVSQTFWSPRGNGLSGFASTSGARLIDSTPPATNRSPSPARTA